MNKQTKSFLASLSSNKDQREEFCQLIERLIYGSDEGFRVTLDTLMRQMTPRRIADMEEGKVIIWLTKPDPGFDRDPGPEWPTENTRMDIVDFSPGSLEHLKYLSEKDGKE